MGIETAPGNPLRSGDLWPNNRA